MKARLANGPPPVPAGALLVGLAVAGLGGPAPARAQPAPLQQDCRELREEERRRCPAANSRTPAPPAGAGAPPGWTAWAGGAVAFGHLLVLDHGVRGLARDARGDVSGALAATGRWLGDWQSSLPWLAGGAVLVGLGTEGPRGLREVPALLGGILAGSMVNETINQAVGRDRPLENDGPLAFDPFDGHASFPSGHAAYAFAIAGSVDAITEGWPPAAVGYGLATVTALSRVYDDKHWLTDVTVGAAVGLVVSRVAAARLLALLEGEQERISAGLEPLVGPGTVGVRLRF